MLTGLPVLQVGVNGVHLTKMRKKLSKGVEARNQVWHMVFQSCFSLAQGQGGSD